MGWNTTVVVLNDALNQIQQDPDFGKKLADACMDQFTLKRTGRPAYISALGHLNAAEVIETHHADGYAIVAVGGNTGVKLGECHYTGFPNTPSNQLNVLRQLAEELGYRLVKKTTR